MARGFLIFIFIFLVNLLRFTQSSLPKCENIIKSKDDCPFCATERIGKECKTQCDSNCKSSQSDNSQGNNNNQGSKPSGGGGGGNCDGIKPCVPIEQANKGYHDRCKQKGLSDDCAQYCKYDLDKKTLMDAYMKHKCQVSDSRPMLYAASNDKDNSRCCKQQGILDGDYSICEPFCNPDSKDWPQKPETKYLKCLSEYEDILQCHYASCRP